MGLVSRAKLFLGVLRGGVVQFLTDNASVVNFEDLLGVRSFTDAVPPSEVSYKWICFHVQVSLSIPFQPAARWFKARTDAARHSHHHGSAVLESTI